MYIPKVLGKIFDVKYLLKICPIFKKLFLWFSDELRTFMHLEFFSRIRYIV